MKREEVHALMRRFIDNQCPTSKANLLIRLMASKENRQQFGELVEDSLTVDDMTGAPVNNKKIEENFEKLESRLSKHRIFKTPHARHWLMGSDQENLLLKNTSPAEIARTLSDT
ncbi:hypothetical protein LZD49_10835 [Dyadobacter sp. CY261]|uniref:hypothetical protein n=1 Tax=Dyadobacter sp. CY261 TaxID=2907203 RepID=UPI001F44E262|nr:hypothetical protein [Dyadobacter sp. CY261]MCF0070969.1 hypothetical protein [Dyadobacter sp. CY261]